MQTELHLKSHPAGWMQTELTPMAIFLYHFGRSHKVEYHPENKSTLMLRHQSQSVFLYMDQLWESIKRADMKMGAEVFCPSLFLRDSSESAVMWLHHLFYLSPFLSWSLYLAFLSPVMGTLNLTVKSLVLIFAFPLWNHVTFLGFIFIICQGKQQIPLRPTRWWVIFSNANSHESQRKGAHILCLWSS